MRISDWSSDVCSSDLVTHFGSSPLSQQASGNTSNESADLIFSIDQADYLNLSVGRRFHLNGRFVCLDRIKWHASTDLRTTFNAPFQKGCSLHAHPKLDRKSTRLNSSN